MAVTVTTNSKSNLKKFTNNDLPFAPAQPVANSYIGVSTAGQTLIANLGFSVDTTNPANFQLYIDGRLQTLGSANDYTFAAIAADGTSSAINLNTSLPVNLNINAIKLGLKKESEFLTDNRFTQLYEAEGQGFQAFVNTANVLNATLTAGAPVAGTFYSTITGRAALVDFSQDLKPRMGIDRLMTQQISVLSNEFGPNGEPVWVAANDTAGQIRFVGGGWSVPPTSSAGNFVVSSLINEFVEVTFYGTGLNMLIVSDAAGRDYRASVDGGAEGSNLYVQAATFTAQKNYGWNEIIQVVSGLTLGTHTVKIRNNPSSALLFFGFEFITASSSILTNPGVSYIQGKKLTLAAQSSIAYNASVTGTRGGHVLHFQKSDGTIGQAFTPTNAIAAYLTSTDHTNEEVVRAYQPREFGAGTASDFSLGTAFIQRAFTLDDGITTLQATSSSMGGVTYTDGVNATNSSSIQFTFIGTGIDLVWYESSTTTLGAFNCFVDGNNVGSLDTTSLAGRTRTIKIASGLVYGSHTVTLIMAASGPGPYITKFVTYQPKIPALPSGAVALADYNVLGNFVSSTATGAGAISLGTMRKANQREFLLVGAWSQGIAPNDVTGYEVYSATAGNYMQYTFFGTGFDFRFTNPAIASTFQISVDGSTSLAGFTNTAYGAGISSYTPSTGTVVTSTTSVIGNGVQITGLPLGMHTFRATIVSGTGAVSYETLDIVTPIYSSRSNTPLDAQNSLTVGSQGIADLRKLTPVKDVIPAKNQVQARGVAVNPTTTSTTPIPVPDLLGPIKTGNGFLDISYSIDAAANVGSNSYIVYQIMVDGMVVSDYRNSSFTAVNAEQTISDRILVPVSAGTHIVVVTWQTASGTTATAVGTRRALIVIEK